MTTPLTGDWLQTGKHNPEIWNFSEGTDLWTVKNNKEKKGEERGIKRKRKE